MGYSQTQGFLIEFAKISQVMPVVARGPSHGLHPRPATPLNAKPYAKPGRHFFRVNSTLSNSLPHTISPDRLFTSPLAAPFHAPFPYFHPFSIIPSTLPSLPLMLLPQKCSWGFEERYISSTLGPRGYAPAAGVFAHILCSAWPPMALLWASIVHVYVQVPENHLDV